MDCYLRSSINICIHKDIKVMPSGSLIIFQCPGKVAFLIELPEGGNITIVSKSTTSSFPQRNPFVKRIAVFLNSFFSS